MSSFVPKKDSLNFLSDYYFDTESRVAFTSPLALYRVAKKHYPSLFIKLKLSYNPKIPTPYINKLDIIFRDTESLLQSLMVSGKQICWTISSLAHFNKGYKFLLTCIDVFSKFACVIQVKNKMGESLVMVFSQS